MSDDDARTAGAAGTAAALPGWAPAGDSRWAVAMRARLAGDPRADGLEEFGRHCAEVREHRDKRGGLKKGWFARTGKLLAANADAAPFAREALGLLAAGPVSGEYEGLALGLVLAVGRARDAGAVPDLLALARTAAALGTGSAAGRNDVLAKGAFWALADIDAPAALDALWSLYRDIDYVVLREDGLAPELREAAARMGVPDEVRRERMVPAHGLLPDGAGALGTFGPSGEGTIHGNYPFRAELAVEDAETVVLTWIDGEGKRTSGGPPFRTPTGYKARYGSANVEGVQRHAKRVRETLMLARRLLRDALQEDLPGRVWTYGDWRPYYIDHPITGVVARRLVWEFAPPGSGDGWVAALPVPGGGFATAGGGAPSVPALEDAARVRLWRPERAGADEIAAWRDRLEDVALRQPFPQLPA